MSILEFVEGGSQAVLRIIIAIMMLLDFTLAGYFVTLAEGILLLV